MVITNIIFASAAATAASATDPTRSPRGSTRPPGSTPSRECRRSFSFGVSGISLGSNSNVSITPWFRACSCVQHRQPPASSEHSSPSPAASKPASTGPASAVY